MMAPRQGGPMVWTDDFWKGIVAFLNVGHCIQISTSSIRVATIVRPKINRYKYLRRFEVVIFFCMHFENILYFLIKMRTLINLIIGQICMSNLPKLHVEFGKYSAMANRPKMSN